MPTLNGTVPTCIEKLIDKWAEYKILNLHHLVCITGFSLPCVTFSHPSGIRVYQQQIFFHPLNTALCQLLSFWNEMNQGSDDDAGVLDTCPSVWHISLPPRRKRDAGSRAAASWFACPAKYLSERLRVKGGRTANSLHLASATDLSSDMKQTISELWDSYVTFYEKNCSVLVVFQLLQQPHLTLCFLTF